MVDSINATFTATVTGPSYPGGISHNFTITSGVLSGSPWLLTNLIPGAYAVTENDLVAWTEVVSGSPASVVSGGQATVNITNTFVPGSLEVTKFVDLTGYLFPNSVNETFTATVTGPSYPGGISHNFTLINGVLSGSPWVLTGLIPGGYSVTENVNNNWVQVVAGSPATLVSGAQATVNITNTIKLPHTTMLPITFNVTEAQVGQNVFLTISDTNDGAVPLHNAHIHLMANGVFVPGFATMFNSSPYFVASSDNNSNGIMDPGETWVWADIPVTINSTTTFLAWGHGIDPWGNPVDYNQQNPADPTSFESEHQTVVVEVNLLTRTQGFWATHLEFTASVFNTSGANISLGWLPPITNISDLMGVFWANNAKNSDGSQRDALCRFREIASNQALAAILNSYAPGGSPLPAGYSLSEIASILSGSNVTAIQKLNTDLTAFNESGDDVAFPDGTVTGHANPKEAKDVANIPFADCSNSIGLQAILPKNKKL